ncbi:hypothetical protein C8T65DRAFT_745747 [Cerioporus squamosus]|nr:hypothetical protein C8T65DRAFT_745747 [Cerioporus squamosus]
MPPVPPLTPAVQDMVRAIRKHEPTLVFECEDHIRGLVQFISADNEEYCRWIRCLHFEVGAISEDVAAMLEYYIADCGKLVPLKDLHLDNAEALLGSDPRLVDAFTVLTNHREDFSSLRSAELSLIYSRTRLPDELFYSDPIHLMSASQDTLERLKASGATTDSPGSHWQTYPNMCRLELVFVDVPRTYDYVAAFPNLEHLTISSALLITSSDALAKCEATRRANRNEQEEYGAWGRSKSVTGLLTDVYMLGLSCYIVHTMDIRVVATSDYSCKMLASVIADGKPNCLRLTTDPGDIADDGIVFALERENTVRLRKLKLIVKVDCNVRAHHIHDTVDCILLAMRELSIPALHLRFDGLGPGRRRRGQLSCHGEPQVARVAPHWESEEAYAALSSTDRERTVTRDVSESDCEDDLSTSSESDGQLESDSEEQSDAAGSGTEEHQEEGRLHTGVGDESSPQGPEDTFGGDADDGYTTDGSVEV